MNTIFKVFGMTQLGVEPKSTSSEAGALSTRPSGQPSMLGVMLLITLQVTILLMLKFMTPLETF